MWVPLSIALHDLGQILASPTLVLLSETDGHAEMMTCVVTAAGATGNLLHDVTSPAKTMIAGKATTV